MKQHLLFVFLLVTFTSNAQPAWRARFFVHFSDGNNQITTDTIQIGCDSLGGIGYQEGLDVFDTVINTNKTLAFDSLVKIERQTGCVNLRKSVKAFKVGITEFDFFAIGKMVALSWDTIDFRYDDSTYALRSAWISSLNAYLEVIDINKYIIYNDLRPQNKYGIDSIRVVQGATINDCFFSDEVVHIKLSVAMGYGISGLEALDEENKYSAFPVPTNRSLHIQFKRTPNYKLEIRNQLGWVVLISQLKDVENTINVESLSDGIYYVMLSDEEHQTTHHQKVMIKH